MYSKDFDVFLSENFENGNHTASGANKKTPTDYRYNYNIYRSIVDIFKNYLTNQFTESYFENYLDENSKIDYIDLIKKIDEEVSEKIKKINSILDLKGLYSDEKYQTNMFVYLQNIKDEMDRVFKSYRYNLRSESKAYHEIVLNNSRELFDLESKNKAAFFDDNNLVDLITSFDKKCYTETDEKYLIYKRDVFKERLDFYKKSGFSNLRDYHKKEDQDIIIDSFSDANDRHEIAVDFTKQLKSYFR